MGTAPKLCLMLTISIAASIAPGQLMAHHKQTTSIATSKPLAGSERTFYRRGLIVDGLPLYTEERQIWNGAAWVPYYSEDGTDARFGIRKIRDKSAE